MTGGRLVPPRAQAEAQYRIFRRIEAEERALETADLIICRRAWPPVRRGSLSCCGASRDAAAAVRSRF